MGKVLNGQTLTGALGKLKRVKSSVIKKILVTRFDRYLLFLNIALKAKHCFNASKTFKWDFSDIISLLPSSSTSKILKNFNFTYLPSVTTLFHLQLLSHSISYQEKRNKKTYRMKEMWKEKITRRREKNLIFLSCSIFSGI